MSLPRLVDPLCPEGPLARFDSKNIALFGVNNCDEDRGEWTYIILTGLLELVMPPWVANNPLGHKDPFFLLPRVPLLGREDNVWIQAMERLGMWKGSALAQGIEHLCKHRQQAEHFDHCKHCRQGEHCICVGNGLAMSALYPEMRYQKRQDLIIWFFDFWMSFANPFAHFHSLSRFSWEIKSVDDLFGVNNSMSRSSTRNIVHCAISKEGKKIGSKSSLLLSHPPTPINFREYVANIGLDHFTIESG